MHVAGRQSKFSKWLLEISDLTGLEWFIHKKTCLSSSMFCQTISKMIINSSHKEWYISSILDTSAFIKRQGI